MRSGKGHARSKKQSQTQTQDVENSRSSRRDSLVSTQIHTGPYLPSPHWEDSLSSQESLALDGVAGPPDKSCKQDPKGPNWYKSLNCTQEGGKKTHKSIPGLKPLNIRGGGIHHVWHAASNYKACRGVRLSSSEWRNSQANSK